MRRQTHTHSTTRSPHPPQASIEQLRTGTREECARQDNTKEWRSVIEISIKGVISGVIAEVLWFLLVCAGQRKKIEWNEKNSKQL